MADKSLNFLVCCANGAGSSLMAQMALEKVLKKHGIEPGNIIARFQKAERLLRSMMW